MLRLRKRQRLPNDVVVDILERHVRTVGWKGNMELLLMNREVTQRLYPAFYHTVKIWKKKQVKRLCATLLFHPRRVRFIHALFVCLDHRHPCSPVFLTPDYPEAFKPGSWHGDWISEKMFGAINHLLEITSPFLQRLTIVSKTDHPEITDAMQKLVLPNLTDLEISSTAMLDLQPGRLKSLTSLRLAIDLSVEGCTQVLENGSLEGYMDLSRLYLSYDNGHILDMEDKAFKLQTPQMIRLLAIEFDSGLHLPMECSVLWRYEVHPKVVFMVDEEWEHCATYGLDATGDNRWRKAHVEDLMLVGVAGRSDVWKQVELKVQKRWIGFEEEFAGLEEERDEILNSATHFVLV
ncbi:hypothetical protein VNI00_017744 [Paramarasmius palmivorus]|uniref:Uncharacterized protein n=1 Tax=Paramarasmius palmivorus TaxID=297713 RepID=A0AAW0B2K2_9AGAR